MSSRDPRSQLPSLLSGLLVETAVEQQAATRLAALLSRTTIAGDVASVVSRTIPIDAVRVLEPPIVRAPPVMRPGLTPPPRISPVPSRPTTPPVPPAAVEEAPQFRVFRRESPLSAAAVTATVPDWARGAAVAETVGPLRADDGRVFWYDFYRIVRLIPVYFAGDAQPAFLFNLRERRFGLAEAIDIDQVLGFFRQRSYRLEKGSVWIRANLLAPAAPAGSFIGLTVRGGTVTVVPQVTVQNGRLTIAAGGQCAIHLDLDAPAAPPFAGGAAGTDAADATLSLPATFSLRLRAGAGTVTALAPASWSLYGQSIEFARRDASVPTFELALNAVVVPYAASVSRLTIGDVKSPFATPAGNADIARAGWSLPVAMIDVAKPTAAAGIGGLAVQTTRGLTIGWRGLRDGPLSLQSPWVALAPGLVLISDAAAEADRATQRLRLWQASAPPGRSTVDLRFARPGPLTYLASSVGSEVLFARSDTSAHIDRPVDVTGTAFAINTLRSQLTLSYTDALRLVFVHDDDLLADALSTDAGWRIERGQPVALAIRNALFTVTPVSSLLLFAALRDDEMIARGTLMLGFGMYTLLPTLPDPYAANVRQLRTARGRNMRPVQLLVASVTWTKSAESDEASDAVTTNFTFAPIGTQADSIIAWTLAADASKRADQLQLAPDTFNSTTVADTPGMFSRQPSASAIWDTLFARFSEENFSLLDVSSNADQMGVSFAFFDPQRLASEQRGRNASPFDLVFAGGPAAPPLPFEIRDMDLAAQNRFVRVFTVPQVSWEPITNLTAPQRAGDPPKQVLLSPNDGGPTRLLSNDVTVVPIAPIPVTDQIVGGFAGRPNTFTGALFTLPHGMRAFAEFTHDNRISPSLRGTTIGFNRPEFESGALQGGIQVRADAPPQANEDALFRGCTVQTENLHTASGLATNTGTLGYSVGRIFNGEFFLDGATQVRNRGVPVTRIDFSGYGASLFSHWQAPNAAIASTSQARFDVFVGRTAHEVIQVRTLLYPWGIRVVRTITMFRASSGYTYRFDTGWQPESDGIFDFAYTVFRYDDAAVPRTPVRVESPYEIHPGVVRGVFNISNITETDDVVGFDTTMTKQNGETYLDQDNLQRKVDAGTPAEERSPKVELVPVWFDGDFMMDGVTAGATGGRIPSKKILGFVQLSPRGEPLTPAAFRDLLKQNMGSIGGAVACEIDVAMSGQKLRASRVDVSPSVKDDGTSPSFVVAARGAVVLPTGGAWSMVRHEQGTGEVSRLDPGATVPLIRRGRLLNAAAHQTDAGAADEFRLANPIELVRAALPETRHFGILQSTGTQKVLFRLPAFRLNLKELRSAPPDFVDAYRLINTKGIFPNVQDAVPLLLGGFRTKIIEEGYKLIDEANPAKLFTQLMPEGPLQLVNESYLKIYIEYKFAAHPQSNAVPGPSVLTLSLDSASAVGEKWLSAVGNIGMVVDLGPIKRLVTIKGGFDAKHGSEPGFRKPELVFADELKPVIDILTLLSELQGGDYAAAMAQGLDVAMSNSADSWNYSFHAKKEFPLVQFPPGEAYHAPQVPLKLQARMAVGCYFNESLTPTTDVKQLLPTAGAFLEFGGSLSVMCVSVGAATVYAVGSVDLRISGDTKTGPGLMMKFGFGAEITAGLPVVGNVSLLFMVGIEISMDLAEVRVTAFLLFRGRAELLGGVVCIQIQIEAKGTYSKGLAKSAPTMMTAQVTFAIDVSIFLVINLHFSTSWQEQRQIA